MNNSNHDICVGSKIRHLFFSNLGKDWKVFSVQNVLIWIAYGKKYNYFSLGAIFSFIALCNFTID